MTAFVFLRSHFLSCAGLVVPPLLWAVNTQLGEVLPYVDCGAGLKWTTLTSFGAAVLSLGAGWLSWRLTRRKAGDAVIQSTPYPLSYGFIATLSSWAGPVFAFALVLQGLSSLVLTACER